MKFKKHFTPSEARKTLPLVRKIVADILETGKTIQKIAAEYDDIPENIPSLQPHFQKLNQFFTELNELECYYKDWNFDMGLVDFPAIIDGQEVFLCWRSDEDDILFYHGLESGYAGRTRLPKIPE